MKRLKKWIDEIRAERNEFAAEYWMCRYTIDTAEFLIHPHVVYQPERFKHTVLRIGMILTRLSAKMEEAGYVYHIQTFPSFEDLKAVASIRLNINFSQGTSKKQTTPPKKASNSIADLSSNEALKQKAKQHNLQLIPMENNGGLHSLVNLSGSFNAWYIIGGHHDNPFAWLHAGFLTEELYQMACISGCNNEPAVVSGPELSNIKDKLTIPNPPEFIHALIALRAEAQESTSV
jgi:hypothetical protein